jgi:prepilin-type N-terminal cleavage/methylation domain-containing protein
MMTGKRKSEIRNSKFEITKNSPKGSSTKLKNCKAFTLVEILTVVFIIAILMGVLMPAFNMIRKKASDVQQKAQLASIDIGLNLYKNESCFGDYPTSYGFSGSGATRTANYNYCGAQTLSEAMLGQDLLGVDPNTSYTVGTGTPPYADEYTPGNSAYNLNNRKGSYLDRTHINVFTASDFYSSYSPVVNKYMISDVYTVKKVQIANSNRKYKIGTPVLYYKANVSKTTIDSNNLSDSVYDSQDNEELIELGSVAKSTNYHYFDHDPAHYAELEPSVDGRKTFYNYIKDPMSSTTTVNRPVRPDSFLLISAGNDGLYGTSDDICNFEPNIE